MSQDERQAARIRDTERELLGGIVVSSTRGNCKLPQVMKVLTPEDFISFEHGLLYKHMIRVYEQGMEVNLITVRASMFETGDLNKLSSSATLISLMDLNYTDAYVEHHAKFLKELSNQRRLQHLGEILAEGKYGTKSVAEIGSEIESVLDAMKKQTSIELDIRYHKKGRYFAEQFKAEQATIAAYAGRSTGFSNIDEQQTFAPGLYVLGGIPALGKTTFAWQLLNQMAAFGEKCIYCSYEMSPLELYAKTLSAETFIRDRQTEMTASQIIRGAQSMTLESVIADQSASDDDMTVLELSDEPLDEVLQMIGAFCRQSERSPIVCLDYLQIIPHKQDSVKAGIDEIVRKLKNFQRATNTTFIVISSFNRTNYLQPVNYESFKESGNIEYTADVVWALQLECMNSLPKDMKSARETVEDAKRENPRRVQLRCLKNRKGNNYDCYFNYYAAHDLFESSVIDDEDDYEYEEEDEDRGW